jgi:hypothetical protein
MTWKRVTASTSCRNVARAGIDSPAPKLPVTSIAHIVASWRRPKAISWR